MCDRGEYLSKGASLTAFKLIPSMAYAPPYRPDLKGLVEVLHRIEKDAQFLFIPGAMDYRRAEFDLRKSHPEESAMTVREYVQYLHSRIVGACGWGLTVRIARELKIARVLVERDTFASAEVLANPSTRLKSLL